MCASSATAKSPKGGGSGKNLVNLGYWAYVSGDRGRQEEGGYTQASRTLTSLVAGAVLVLRTGEVEGGDKVLCVGCGGGEELQMVYQDYYVENVVGIDLQPLGVHVCFSEYAVERSQSEVYVCACDLRALSPRSLPPPPPPPLHPLSRSVSLSVFDIGNSMPWCVQERGVREGENVCVYSCVLRVCVCVHVRVLVCVYAFPLYFIPCPKHATNV